MGNATAARLATLPSLRHVYLRQTRVTEAGVDALAALPHLVRLWVPRTIVPPAALAGFLERYPRVTICD